MRRAAVVAGLLVVASVLAGCGSDGTIVDKRPVPSTAPTHEMQLTSPSFADGATIPTQFTCTGAGEAPELRWSAPPAGTKELALLVFDPDAGGGGFVHQLGWGIDPKLRGAPQNHYGLGGIPGMNGLGRENWTPPCPPSGAQHHYEFMVFALSEHPEFTYTANIKQFLDGIRGIVLAEGHLTGLYGH